MLSFKFTVSYQLLILAAIALTVASCARKYRPQPLTTFGSNNSKDITVLAEELTPSDCAHYFSKRVSKKTKDLVPVQLTIHNNTTDTYEFKASDLSMPVVNRCTLAHKVHYHTNKRATTWGILDVLIFPIIFTVAGIADIHKAHSTNNKVDSDFDARVISNDSVVQIKPHSTVAKVFFVPEVAYESELTVKLTNTNTRKTDVVELDLNSEK